RPLQRQVRLVLPDVEFGDRGGPVGLGRPPPLDTLVAGPLEDRQRVPAGLLLGLLGPPLLLLELVVDLLLGLGVLRLARLGIPLIGLEAPLAHPGVFRLHRLQVDLNLGGELLRRRRVVLLVPGDAPANARPGPAPTL